MKLNGVQFIDEQQLCIGCGLCSSIAGTENIQMLIGDDAFYHPEIFGSEKDWWPMIKKER